MIASISRLAGVLVIAGASFVAAGLVGGQFEGGMTWAQSKAIQSQESNVSGVTIEITEMRRKDGVLTIRLRLVNSSSASNAIMMGQGAVSNNWGEIYVTAGKQKYLVLRDTDRTALAAYGQLAVPKGGSTTWWAKFPAPGPEVKKVNFFTPHTPPFEDVPITD